MRKEDWQAGFNVAVPVKYWVLGGGNCFPFVLQLTNYEQLWNPTLKHLQFVYNLFSIKVQMRKEVPVYAMSIKFQRIRSNRIENCSC